MTDMLTSPPLQLPAKQQACQWCWGCPLEAAWPIADTLDAVVSHATVVLTLSEIPRYREHQFSQGCAPDELRGTRRPLIDWRIALPAAGQSNTLGREYKHAMGNEQPACCLSCKT